MFRKPTYEELEQKVKQLENEVVGFKQTEEALRESEERLSLATRATIDAIWDYDLVRDTVWWNEAYDLNFGTRPEDSQNSWKWWLDHIHPEDRDRVLESIHAALDGEGESWTETYHYRRTDGTYAYVLGRACIARDTSGKARRIFGAMLDFTERNKVEGALGKLNIELEDRVDRQTAELVKANEQLKQEIEERKQTEEALRESEKRYRTLFEGSKDAIFINTREGNFLEFNQSFLDLFAYTREEMLKLNAVKLYSDPNNRVKVQQEKEQNGFVKDYEVKLCKKDGTKIDCLLTSNVMKASDGSILGQGIIRDISERKRAEEALRKAKDELEMRVDERTAELAKTNEQLRREVVERKQAEEELQKAHDELEHRVEERTRELEIKTGTLEEINTALNVLLKKRQEDKIALEEKVVGNVKELVTPYLERMKENDLDDKQQTFLNILESNLNEIISPFSRKLSSKYLNLTPAEIQVADLVRQGKRTKEIATLFNLSYKTVESHRDNIRKKIGIKNKKANLRSYLLSLP